MAKPINLYQGQAPSAFGQMGAGIAEAGAGIAKAIQAGDAQMGAGIAGGVNAAVGEYAKYKDVKSSVTASEKAYETLRSFLPKELQFAMDAQIESMGSDTGISLNDKKHFWEQTNAMLGASVKQAMDLQKQQKELDARAGLQAANEAAQNWRTLQQIDSAENEPFRRQAASMMTSGFGGTSKSSGYGGGKAPGNVSLYGDTPFTFGSHF